MRVVDRARRAGKSPARPDGPRSPTSMPRMTRRGRVMRTPWPAQFLLVVQPFRCLLGHPAHYAPVDSQLQKGNAGVPTGAHSLSCKRFAIALTAWPGFAMRNWRPPQTRGIHATADFSPAPCCSHRAGRLVHVPVRPHRRRSSRSSPPSPSSPTSRATSRATRPIVESITKPGAEIHNYQPTPGDIVAGAGRRSDPVERAEPRALVRAASSTTCATCRASWSPRASSRWASPRAPTPASPTRMPGCRRATR